MKRLVLIAAIGMFGALASGGCGPSAEELAQKKAEEEAARKAEEARDKKIDALAERIRAFTTGWEESFQRSWRREVDRARIDGPAEFRTSTFMRALLIGLLALLGGILTRGLMAIRKPRWWPSLASKPVRGAADAERPAFAKQVLRWIVGGTKAALRQLINVAAGPAEERDVWVQEICEARDAERHLGEAERVIGEQAEAAEAKLQAAEKRVAEVEPDPEASDDEEVDEAAVDAADAAATRAREKHQVATQLHETLGRWRTELASVRRHLAEGGTAGRAGGSRELLDALDEHQRRAEELRVVVSRAHLAGQDADMPIWEEWLAIAEQRPKLPAVRDEEAPPWARTAGYAGLGAATMAVLLLAGWSAAGAMPLFLGVLLTVGGVGAVIVSRANLQHRRQASLLPGLADNLVNRLLILVGGASVVFILSSLTAAESGLNLGQPPPLEAPVRVDVPQPPVTELPRPLRLEMSRDRAPSPSPAAPEPPPASP